MTAAVRAAAGVWDRFWFAPGAALNLGAARVLIAAHALWVLLSRDFAGIAEAPGPFWAGVPPAVRWRYLLFPGHAGLEAALQVVCAVALAAVLLGVAPRLASLVSAVLLYHLSPLETIFWTPSLYTRGFEISIIALVVLAGSRCGDALSIVRRGAAPPAPSWEYHWPVVLIQLFVAQLYFFAGWSKIVHHGFGWADPDYIRRWLLLLNQEEQLVVFHRFGLWLADRPLACLAIGIGGYAMDLSFLLVMFWRRSRAVLVPLAALFHVVIIFSMNIFFLNVPQLLVFVDWEAWVARRRARSAPATVPAAATA